MSEKQIPSQSEINKLTKESEAMLQKNREQYFKMIGKDKELMLGAPLSHTQGLWMASAGIILGGWNLQVDATKSSAVCTGMSVGASLGIHISYGSLATTKDPSELGDFTGWLAAATGGAGYVHIHMYDGGEPIGVFNGGNIGLDLSGAYTWGKF